MEHLTTNYFWNEHKYKFKHVTQHSPDINNTKQTGWVNHNYFSLNENIQLFTSSFISLITSLSLFK
jgi:hypothetical protein